MASFSVVSNISAAGAQANLINTNAGLQKAITRLSSGFRINQAGDDDGQSGGGAAHLQWGAAQAACDNASDGCCDKSGHDGCSGGGGDAEREWKCNEEDDEGCRKVGSEVAEEAGFGCFAPASGRAVGVGGDRSGVVWLRHWNFLRFGNTDSSSVGMLSRAMTR